MGIDGFGKIVPCQLMRRRFRGSLYVPPPSETALPCF
jgi:hypothetical protein